jgi:hypothetical protein
MFGGAAAPPPPINIHLVNGNNNKTESTPLVQAPTQASTQSPTQAPAQTSEDDVFSKPMIRGSNNVAESEALETLGNGKGSFIVKKI